MTTYIRTRPKEEITFVVKRSVKRYLQDGKRYFDSGNIGRAIEAYQSALLVDPNCALTHFNLGFAYHEEHCYEEARAAYRRAIEIMPGCSLFHEHLGRLYFEQNEYARAIESFQRALDVGDVQPISYGLLGRCYYETAEYEKSADSLEMMLAREDHPPLVAVARYHLILAYLKLSWPVQARRTVQALLGAESVDPSLLADLGERFVRAKNITVARQLFERVIQHAEERVSARRRYDDILAIHRKVSDILPELAQENCDEERQLRILHVLLDIGADEVADALGVLFQQTRSALVREIVIEYHRRYGYLLPDGCESLLDDECEYVCERAAAYVATIRPNNAPELMRACLQHRYDVVRRRAASYFFEFGTIEHLPHLENAIAATANEAARTRMCEAIDAIRRRYEERRAAMARRRCEGTPRRKPWLIRWVMGGSACLSLGYILYWVVQHGLEAAVFFHASG